MEVEMLKEETINKWDKSIPVEENTYYWKGEPIITKGNFIPNNRPIVVELFCGCGGTSVGFEMAGYQIAVGADLLKPAIETFKEVISPNIGINTFLCLLSYHLEFIPYLSLPTTIAVLPS